MRRRHGGPAFRPIGQSEVQYGRNCLSQVVESQDWFRQIGCRGAEVRLIDLYTDTPFRIRIADTDCHIDAGADCGGYAPTVANLMV